MSNQDYYYISFGGQQKLFTLRHYSIETGWTRGEGGAPVAYLKQADHHVVNLGIKYEQALAKAKRYAKARGKELRQTSRGIELNQINRRTQEEVDAEKKAIEDARQAKIDAEEKAFNSRISQMLDTIHNGNMPFGNHKGKELDELDKDYVLYLLNSAPRENEKPQWGFVNEALKKKLAEVWPQLANLPVANGEHFGTPGQKKARAKATLIGKSFYEGYYGYVDIDKLVAETGELLVYKGSSSKFSMDDLGKTFDLEFTVKEHDEYKDQAQTSIIRIKATASE